MSINIKPLIVIFLLLTLSINSINANTVNREIKESIKAKIVPETTEQFNTTFQSGKYKLYAEVYYPVDDTKIYPCIVFCEGFPAYVSAYNWIPKSLAEEGYVVIIYDPPGLGKSEGDLPFFFNISFPLLNLYYRFGVSFSKWPHYLRQDYTNAASNALTYMLENSSVKNIIDDSKIGIMGHSFGGAVATEVVVKDDRFDTIIALSHGNTFVSNKVNKSILFICGGMDIGYLSISNTLASYERANPSKELIFIQLGTHLGFTTVFRKFCPCPPWQKDIIKSYSIGWFDYHLKNQISGYEIITNGTDHLSKFYESKYDFGDGEHIISV